MKVCPKTGQVCYTLDCHASLDSSLECKLNNWMNPITSYKFPLPPKLAYIPLDHLRSIYAGLGRAIESGDPLQIGLILGQVYKELEQYVNTTTTGDNSFTVPVNTESHGVQRSSDTRPDITFGNKE